MMVMVTIVTKSDDQVLRLEKKTSVDQGYQIGFCFGTQDTIEGVSAIRIDSYTIKRRNLWLSGY
jgi:hypothetical protein